MRTFGVVPTSIYEYAREHGWPPLQTFFLAYLYSCDRANSVGCFRYAMNHVAEDLNFNEHDAGMVSDIVRALCDHGALIVRGSWIHVASYVRDVPLRNPSVATSAFNLWRTLPDKMRKAVANDLLSHCKHLSPNQRTELKAFEAPCPHDATIMPAYREREGEKIQRERSVKTLVKTEAVSTGERSRVSTNEIEKVKSAGESITKPKRKRADPTALPPDVQTAVDCYREGHPGRLLHPHTGMREIKAVVARYAEGHTVDDICLAIAGLRLSPHHQGINDGGIRYDGLYYAVKDSTALDRHAQRARDANNGVNLGAESEKSIRNRAVLEAWEADRKARGLNT